MRINFSYWNIIKERSGNFSRPLTINNCFSSGLFEENDVLEVLKNLCLIELSRLTTRVFIDGSLNYNGNELIYKNPPTENDSIESWWNKIFKDKKYGIIINHAHQYHDLLGIKTAKLFNKLFKLNDFPSGGIDVVIFIGNYGFTPFGIHHDDEISDIFHFHILGEKTMTVWHPDEYYKITGSYDSFLEPEKIINTGNSFLLQPNTIYFMPSNMYHIGFTPNFSCAITFGLMKKTLEELILDSSKQKIKSIITLKDFKERASITQKINKNLFKRPCPDLNDFINTSLSENELKFKSNNGLISSPLITKENIELNLNLKIKRVSPFRLYYATDIIDDERSIIFARGSRISLKMHKNVVQMIELLNESSQPIELLSLYSLFEREWHVETFLLLIKNLLEAKSIFIEE